MQAPTHVHTSPHPGPIGWTKRHTFSYRLIKPPSDGPSTSLSQFPTKNQSKSPSWGPFKNPNKKSEHIAELGSIWIFQPCILLFYRDQVQLKNPEENPILCPKFLSIPVVNHRLVQIAEPGSVWKFTTKNPTISPNQDPSRKFTRKPPCPIRSTYPVTNQENLHHVHPVTLLFQNSTPTPPLPHTHPTTHINLQPPLLPLSPPLIHLIHGLYQAALGSHTDHTVLLLKDGSQSRVQYRMQSCIQSCEGG